jgi:hypothetical protein
MLYCHFAKAKCRGRHEPFRNDLGSLFQKRWRRQIDAILVWRLDRWARSLLNLIGSLQELSTLGVGFVSLCEAAAPNARWSCGPTRCPRFSLKVSVAGTARHR